MLEAELKTFDEKRHDLLVTDKGRFVLIKGPDIVGVFDTANDAYECGLEKFGPEEPFLIKQVLEVEIPANFIHLPN